MALLNPTAASILGFLQWHDRMTGYEVAAFAERTIGDFWNVSRSQIYRELRDLAERGFVQAGEAGPRDRLPYRITAAGRSAFRSWIASDPGPDLIRHRLLLTVFFAEHLTPDRLATLIGEQRAGHEERLTLYRSAERTVPDGPAALTLAFGIAYERMVIAWLNDVDRRYIRRRSARRSP